MSKNAVSHRKSKFSILTFLALLLAVVSISFGTIIYSADSSSSEKNQDENSVFQTHSLKSFLNKNLTLNKNIFSSKSFLAPDTVFVVNDSSDTNDAAPGDGICLDAAGHCTLRAAIQEANAKQGTDEIIFAISTPAIIQLNPNLSQGELAITEAVTITGPGPRLLTISGVISSGARTPENAEVTTGIFKIDAAVSAPVAISGLTITSSEGRGINNYGRLNLTDVVIREHSFGIYNTGTLNLSRLLISNNSSGGIYLSSSSIANISNTTITNNASANYGGGIHSLSADLTLNNVTISHNSAATSGGGLYYGGSASGVYVRNALIANNTAPSEPDVLSANNSTGAIFISRGNNLIGKSGASMGFVNGENGDKVGTIAAPIDPKLGKLQNNGGQIDTRALQDESPARDTGNNCVTNSNCGGNNPPVNPLGTDQRGADFPRLYGAAVDIGAFESYYPVPSINSLNPNNWGTGRGDFELVVNGTNFVADSVVKWKGQNKTTVFVSNTQLRAQILAADVETAGQYDVQIKNPQPNGGDSEIVNFVVADCAYTLNPVSEDFAAAGGSGNFTVITSNGCGWTATSNAPWITINSLGNGRGTGAVSFTVAVNNGAERTGTITVENKTFTVTQSSGCTYTLNPTAKNVTAAGETGTFTITTSTGCQWTAVSNSSWITITSGGSGTGDGTVNFSVAANTSLERTGTITVGSQTFTITQANGCAYSLSSSSAAVTAGGGSSSFNVVAGTGCQWTAVSNSSWITITSGGSGTGNGTVNFTVAANTGQERMGTITVENKTFNITQAAGCTFTLNPTAKNVTAAGETGSFSVASPTGCQWTAVSNSSWITVTSGSTGSGSGTVNFSVAANTGPARTGTITVNNQTFTITQASGCIFTLSPTSADLQPGGGTGFFDVSAGTGCTWTAQSSAGWITVTSGSPGSGNGRVNYSVAVNNGPTRTGTISVDNKTFTVTQQNGCTFTLSPTSKNVSAANETGSFTVTPSANGCQWTAVSNSSWITITSGGSGTGDGTVNFSVAANTGPARTGTITVNNQTFTITQANGCTYSLSPISTSFTPAGGSGSFSVTTNNPACTWTATTTQSWIVINAPASGTGNGEVSFTVLANVSPQRTGTISVNGRIFTITQEDGCSYTLSPTFKDVPASAGSYSFNVNSGAGCTWTAQSNASWITITSSVNGTGTGSVNFSVAANNGPARTGTITTGGQTFTVNQANGCMFTLTPTSANFSSAANAGSFTVTTVTGCVWTAESNSSWIVVTNGASGNGNGTVQFSVQANISPQRTGTITVKGQNVGSEKIFTITQQNGCTYSINPNITGINEDGGSRSFNVTAGPGCAWTAVSNDSWITVTAGATGSGNGTVSLNIAASSGEERTGTVTAAGQTFTVNQISLKVTNLNDGGIGSLRRAIANANSTPNDDVVTFAPSLTGIIILTSGEITIANNGKLEIAGPGADRLAVSGNRNSRIFYVNNANFTIKGLTLTGGNGAGADSSEIKYGGAIYVKSGSLTLDGVEVYDNVISVPSGQTSRSLGGGVYFSGGMNHRIQNSTFSFNRSDYGAGYYNQTGSVLITNSTFYGNTANKEGGAISAVGNTMLRNVTITKNNSNGSLQRGAGILNEGGRIDLANSIIAENNGAEITYAAGEFFSLGNNLIGDSPGDSSNTENPIVYNASDLRDVPPKLSIVYRFGGGTRTAALLPGSPAINAGGNIEVPAVDQRGVARPAEGAADIGAFEFNIAVLPLSATLPNAKVGTFYSQQFTTSRVNKNDPFEYFQYFLIDGYLPRGLQFSIQGYVDGTPESSVTETFTIASFGTDGTAGVNTYTVTVGCSVAINPANQAFNKEGGNGTINVTAGTGCNWNAQSGASWISITSGANGSGNGTVNFTVAANNGAARSGTITIGGQTFTVTQLTGCSYSISPTSQNIDFSARTGSFTVTTVTGCPWDATANAGWITITSGGSGTGGGTVNFSAAANTGPARTGTITVAGQTFTVNQSAAPIKRVPFEFDGDGKSDIAVYRPSNGVWHLLRSRDGYLGVQFGVATDKLVAADYDGDGKTDVAVYRAGVWHLLRSRDGYTGIQFGTADDIPQPGDFDGDGKADLAVFRTTNGVWYVLASRDGFSAVSFGVTTDKPVAADYDGDGRTDAAVYRNGIWHVLNSRDGYIGIQFGVATDKPVQADYDGDGKTDVAVYRAGVWHLLRSRDGYTGIQFGIATDKPVPADYDGDGKADLAVYRDGIWHLLESGQSESQGYKAYQFGEPSDIPIPAALQ